MQRSGNCVRKGPRVKLENRNPPVIEGITPNIAWYFFLAGAGSGAFMVHVALGLVAPEPAPRLTASSPAPSPALAPIACAALVLAGSLFLLADLGVPALFLLAIRGLGHSVISFGMLSITLFATLSLAYAVAVLPSAPKLLSALTNVLKWTAFAAALATACYTGFYLFSIKAVSLWSTPLIMLLFLASALSSGSGALMLLTLTSHPARRRVQLQRLCKTDLLLIVIEAATLLAFAASRMHAGGDAAALMMEMLAGGHALPFLLGAVGLGVLTPPLLEHAFVQGAGEHTAYLAALCTLAGGFALRCCIILV